MYSTEPGHRMVLSAGLPLPLPLRWNRTSFPDTMVNKVQYILDTGGSTMNKVGWPQHDRAEGFRSWRRGWVVLVSPAGEELGPGLAEDTFLRESVIKEERCFYPTLGCQTKASAKCRGSNNHSFLSSHIHATTLCSQREVRPWPSLLDRGCSLPCCPWSSLQGVSLPVQKSIPFLVSSATGAVRTISLLLKSHQ
jgi:hypothetical protein